MIKAVKYFVIFSKESIDINNSSGLIFRTICKNYFFKRKYSIYNNENYLLCVFEKSDFLLFFTRTKIITNNLGYDFLYYQKGQTYFLKLKNGIISYRGKFIGYLKSEFILNNKVIGSINEEYEFPNNKISFVFSENNTVNYCCLLLFIISSTANWDPN